MRFRSPLSPSAFCNDWKSLFPWLSRTTASISNTALSDASPNSAANREGKLAVQSFPLRVIS